ncbi:hypothetical protein EC988_000101 [Linderina pennispora]|nr:hypothetical protein EC988_000101 [Linderina pennispora]
MKLAALLVSSLAVVSALPASNALADSRLTKRVFGGSLVDAADMTFIVQLRLFLSSKYSSACTGSIVAPDTVITAAHCMYDPTTGKKIEPRNMLVYTGSHVRSEMDGVFATEIIPNPGWNPSTYNGDIGIVKIPAMALGGNTSRVAISTGEVNIGDTLQVAGWGRNGNGVDDLPKTLLTTTLKVGSTDYCSLLYPGYTGPHGDGFCTQNSLTPGNSICSGDSGSPIMTKGTDGRYYLAGISSSGGNVVNDNDHSCNSSDGVAYFGSAGKFLKFLTEASGLSSDSLTKY